MGNIKQINMETRKKNIDSDLLKKKKNVIQKDWYLLYWIDRNRKY